MLATKPATQPAEGSLMERINLGFLYECGAQLRYLTTLTPDINGRIPIFYASVLANSYVYSILDFYKSLNVCRMPGRELTLAIFGMQKWMRETPPDQLRKADSAVDQLFSDVINKAKRFETVLLAELATLAVYHITQKGAYYTPDLIDRTEIVLPEPIQNRMTENVKNEIRQSGKCLAFDNPTASGFHIIRAIEGVMHQYYVVVCKPGKPDKLDSWGAYIAALYKSSDPTVKETVAILQQIKDNDRNLIMHPERVLSPDDALTLFEIAKGAIMAMAGKLPEIKAAPPPLPHRFYGMATIDGNPAPDGTPIFGLGVSLSSRDTETLAGRYELYVESLGGPLEGKQVTFKIGGLLAQQTAVWQMGANSNLDLSARTT